VVQNRLHLFNFGLGEIILSVVGYEYEPTTEISFENDLSKESIESLELTKRK
jgi:hypothetical protein